MNAARVASWHGQGGYLAGALMTLLLILLAALGVGWVYAGMVKQDQWPIRWLEVDGQFDRVSAEQLRAGLSPLVNGTYFTVDLGRVREAAFRQPWVSEAVVQKVWPDTVRVEVEEYRPVAHWTQGRLIAQDGSAFEVPGADEIQGLPWLSSPDAGLEDVVSAWQNYNNLLAPVGLEIERIQLDPRGSWNLVLTNGTQVRLGRENAERRLMRLVQSWPLLTASRDGVPAGVDLRYTNGFAVRWPQQDGNNGKES